MSFILLKASNSLFTKELKAKASDYLGETEGNITKALGAILPCLLGFFAEKSSIHNDSNSLASMINIQYASAAHLNLEQYFSIEHGSLLNKGDRIAGELLGSKTGNFIGNVSTYAGIKPASAACLLSIAVPALLALMGSSSISGYDGNVSRIFEGRYKEIQTAIPRGFNVKSILNDAGTNDHSLYALNNKAKKGNGLYWALSIVAVILAAIIAWYFLTRRL